MRLIFFSGLALLLNVAETAVNENGFLREEDEIRGTPLGPMEKKAPIRFTGGSKRKWKLK